MPVPSVFHNRKKIPGQPFSSLKQEDGFTLIEAILAIVIIGIALPALFIPFSGLGDLKTPEYNVQAGFWGLRQLEGLRNETLARMPAAGTYDCTTFQTTPSPNFDIDCSSTEYDFSWEVEEVAANDPDTASLGATFGKKVTMTITRADGNMGALNFYALF